MVNHWYFYGFDADFGPFYIKFCGYFRYTGQIYFNGAWPWEAVKVMRRVPFAGALNFRDIGGYPAGGGGQTRWGVVYRSDSLHFLTPEDLPAFDALRIKVIYDLRRSEELALYPGTREHVHLELPNRNPLDEGQPEGLATRQDGERWLLADYRGMLASAAASFGELFSRLADPGRLPAVIHCLGGKDRTGLTVALLLTALGAPREAVLDDYQLTGDYRGVAQSPEVVELFVGSGITREAAEALLGTPRWVMAQALGELDETYAGIEGYLLGPGGMRPATLTALRAALVSPNTAVPNTAVPGGASTNGGDHP
jgi:protein-tyrosine phosphatase